MDMAWYVPFPHWTKGTEMAGNSRFSLKKLWQTLSSIKTGVILLIITVIVSAAGTLILQRPMTDPDDMQRAYSPHMLRILDGLGLTDVFHAWWFLLLLALVSLSIIAASVQRFPNAWRFYSRPYKSTDQTFRKMLPVQARIPITNEDEGIATVDRAFRKAGFKPQRVIGPGETALFGERHRISHMAVYIVHASLLLIFLGGIVDGLFGWRGYVALSKGEQANQVEVRDHGNRLLSFAVRCDSAGQENYADGSPKKWWSNLVVVENGRPVLRKQIVVNDPLVYRGVRFYQASYGHTAKVDALVLDATPLSGKASAQEITLGADNTVSLDADTTVRMAEFIPDYAARDGQVYTRSNQLGDPAARLEIESKKSGRKFDYWLPAIQGVEHNALAPYKFEAKDLQMAYFTGLQVSHEPGQWAVWAGVVLMGFGLVFVFYVVHQRVWAVPVRDESGKLLLWVGGAANKNKDVFEEKFKDLAEQIRSEMKKKSAARVDPREERELAELSAR
jgi:cytochrome c biogenesis protein